MLEASHLILAGKAFLNDYRLPTIDNFTPTTRVASQSSAINDIRLPYELNMGVTVPPHQMHSSALVYPCV